MELLSVPSSKTVIGFLVRFSQLFLHREWLLADGNSPRPFACEVIDVFRSLVMPPAKRKRNYHYQPQQVADREAETHGSFSVEVGLEQSAWRTKQKLPC